MKFISLTVIALISNISAIRLDQMAVEEGNEAVTAYCDKDCKSKAA